MDKIIGIGNALVDILVTLKDEQLLKDLHFPKGSMQLIDEVKLRQISELFKTMHTYRATGGSVCNAMLALANLGMKPGIIGKVGYDETGDFFYQNALSHGIDARLGKSDLPSGIASTFITPDGQRTFGTFLGASATMSAADLSAETFRGYQYLFVEGYLVQNHELVLRACQLARELGMTICYDLASYNIVEGDHAFISQVVREYVDILFANEEEARAFAKADVKQAIDELAQCCRVAVVKVGAEGAYIKSGDTCVHVPAMPVEKVVDTNAAGDFFAAGFLYGYLQGCPLEVCGRIGAVLAGHVIQTVGTALPEDEWNEIKLKINTIL